MLFIIGITVNFFLELILLSKKNKSLSDKILALWLLFMGLHLLTYYLRYSELIFNYPFVLGINLPFPLLHSPFLLLYIMALTNQMPKTKARILIHFIPTVLSYFMLMPFFMLPAIERIEVYKNEGKGFELVTNIIFLAIIIVSITYFVWSIILLKKHRKKIKNLFSDTDKTNLIWLRYLIYGLGSIYLVSFLFKEMYIFVALVIFVNFVGYFGIKQVGIFTNAKIIKASDNIIEQVVSDTAEDAKQKYAKSGLSEDKSDKIYQNLTHLMESEELYKRSDITLIDLAENLKVHPNYLSQIINEKTSCNFYVYINNLRINAFLKLINNPNNKNIKLISLAYDCGFNSKSSFNKYFKNVVGKTPTEYLKSNS